MGCLPRPRKEWQVALVLPQAGWVLETRLHRLVRDLSVAQQQMVEIARALSMQSRLIVMDEPTSELSQSGVEQLSKPVRDWKA